MRLFSVDRTGSQPLYHNPFQDNFFRDPKFGDSLTLATRVPLVMGLARYSEAAVTALNSPSEPRVARSSPFSLTALSPRFESGDDDG